MYKAKQIDGEWVVVDDNDEIVNSEVDGRISAITTASRMNREENDSGSSNVKIHRGNSYGNTNDDEDLNEDNNYYNQEFGQLKQELDSYGYTLQVRDSEGNKTKWLTLHKPLSTIKNLFVSEKIDEAFNLEQDISDKILDNMESLSDSINNIKKLVREIRTASVKDQGTNSFSFKMSRESHDRMASFIEKRILGQLENLPDMIKAVENMVLMKDESAKPEITEAFGKEGRISPFDAHQIVSNFDNKDFFELDFDQKDQLSNLMKKYKYRQSKLSGSSGRSELRSFYYYLEKLAAKWEKSPNNKNNVSKNSEEIDEAIKLYTPDTNVEELDTNELKNYISFIQQKMKEIKDEKEKEKFNAALSRAEEELDEREDNENIDESLNESLISTIYKTIIK